MSKRPQTSRRLDHVDRQSQVGVSGAMRARDVSRPGGDDLAMADADDDEPGDTSPPSERRPGS